MILGTKSSFLKHSKAKGGDTELRSLNDLVVALAARGCPGTEHSGRTAASQLQLLQSRAPHSSEASGTPVPIQVRGKPLF